MKFRTSHSLVAFGLCLYVTSLFLPVFQCSRNAERIGYEILVMGWMGLIGFDPRWYANFLALWYCIKALRDRPSKNAYFAAVLIISFSVSSLFIPSLGCNSGAGETSRHLGLLVGGYIWVASMLVFAVHIFLFSNRTVMNDIPQAN